MLKITNYDSKRLESFQAFKSIKTHQERITEADKRKISILDYDDIKFPIFKKDHGKIEKKNSVCINLLTY